MTADEIRSQFDLYPHEEQEPVEGNHWYRTLPTSRLMIEDSRTAKTKAIAELAAQVADLITTIKEAQK